MSFLEIFGTFAWSAHCIALGLGGVACLRLWKRGAAKVFAVAAWLALAGAILFCLTWLGGWVMPFFPASPLWLELTTHILNVGDMFLFGHLLAFAVAAFRTAARLPAPPRANARAEEASH